LAKRWPPVALIAWGNIAPIHRQAVPGVPSATRPLPLSPPLHRPARHVFDWWRRSGGRRMAWKYLFIPVPNKDDNGNRWSWTFGLLD
jgi:hypothetical protein